VLLARFFVDRWYDFRILVCGMNVKNSVVSEIFLLIDGMILGYIRPYGFRIYVLG
jgi:hypothetical protein